MALLLLRQTDLGRLPVLASHKLLSSPKYDYSVNDRVFAAKYRGPHVGEKWQIPVDTGRREDRTERRLISREK